MKDNNTGFSEDEKTVEAVKKADKPVKKGRKAALSRSEKKKLTVVISICAVVVAVAVMFAVCAIVARVNCQPFTLKNMFNVQPKSEAVIVSIDGFDIKASEYNYLYNVQIQQFIQTYSDSLDEMGLDVDKPLGDQPCYYSSSISWKEYFIQETNEYVKQYAVMYTAAVNDGITLTKSETASIDSYITAMQTNADSVSYTLEDYITTLFGTTCNEATIRETMAHVLMAQSYMTKYMEKQTYTEDEINAYLEENKSNYIAATYNVFKFTADSTDISSVSAAKANARKFINGVTDSYSFAKLAYEYASDDEKETYAAESATSYENVTRTYVNNTAIADWLFDDDRKVGDKTVIYSSATGCAYAVLFRGTAYEDMLTANVRCLYFGAKTDEFAEFTDAEAKAKELQQEFLDAGGSDDAFKALCDKYYSYDSSNLGSGYYGNLMPSEMPDSILAWCYESGRKAGDYAILDDDNGYFLIYFVSYGDQIWHEKVRLALAENSVYDAVDSTIEEADIKESRYFYELVGI